MSRLTSAELAAIRDAEDEMAMMFAAQYSPPLYLKRIRHDATADRDGGEFAIVDFVVLDGDPADGNTSFMGFAEMKDRTGGRGYSSDDMRRLGGFHVNRDKIVGLIKFKRFARAPVVLVMRCTDGLFWIEIDKIDATRIRRGGRTDRPGRGFVSDFGDRVEIPVEHCQRVGRYD